MASVRLTNPIRDEIKRKVLNRTFDKLHEELRDQEHELAILCYEQAFSKKDRKLMDSMPDGWLGTRSSFQVHFEEGVLGHQGLRFKSDITMPFPNNKNNYNAQVSIAVGSEIENVTVQWKKDKEEVSQKFARARNSVWAILDSVTTVTKLLKIWPEAEDFIVPYLNDAKCTLPAVQFKEVNKLLGLPPTKK